MIDRQAINVDCAANSPEEAIREAGNALCRAGACSPQYVQQWSIATASWARILSLPPGWPCRMPARNRLREPLAFGHAENDPVQVVLGLSATSSDAHIRLIQHIVTVLSDENNLHTLMHSRDPEQLYRLLASGSQRL